jgi:hypothetical protein
MELLIGIYKGGVILYGLIIVAAGIADQKVSPAVVIASILLAPIWPVVVGAVIYNMRRKK